ncbi:MAG: Rod shape-determining protein MreC [Gemmatimonadetes bacterium]|nr:Rod shape-determining protein MreC [Gemmatimonadota bacterium]
MANAARLSSRIDAGLLAGCVVLSLVAVVLPAVDREPIASALRRTVVAPLVSLQAGAERWRSAWVSAEQRRIVADSVALRAIKAQALQLENDQLRRVIGLGTRLEWGFVPAEALHSTEPSEDVVRTMTLTAGSTAGIKRYSPVVAPEGLVGTIQNADPTMSIAILYTHPDFRASAMSADGAAFGIVYPHASRGAGGDAYMLELRGVPTRVNLKPGTVLYTSGLGGTYPRGIAIGSVVQELKTAEVWTRTYLLRPTVTPSRVTTVLVLTAQRVTQGVGNVWGAAVNADSAAKRIAAAGDSIARQSAVLEAQARQAALDSVRRATIDSVKRALGVQAAPVQGAPGQAAPVVRDTAALNRRPAPGVTPAAPTPPRPIVSPRDTTRVRRDSIRPDTTRKPRP